jgi:uncharacterized protein (DUF2384 family)
MSVENELSERLKEYPKIYVDILDLFKEAKPALRWLKKPRIQLSGMTPISILKQDPKKVEDLIFSIKTGDFS